MFFEGAQTHWDQPREPPGTSGLRPRLERALPAHHAGAVFPREAARATQSHFADYYYLDFVTSGSTFSPLAFWRI